MTIADQVAAGRTLARAAGIDGVADDDTRYRLTAATPGARVLTVVDDAGVALFTAAEVDGGWQVTAAGVAGEAATFRRDLAAAVAAGRFTADILRTPLPDEPPRLATLDDMARFWPDLSRDELAAAMQAITDGGGVLHVMRGGRLPGDATEP